MKKLEFVHRNKAYKLILSASGNGICDVSIYRKRDSKKWYQGWWQELNSFICTPISIYDLTQTAKRLIDETEEDESVKESFLSEYRKLEDLWHA